MKRLFLTTAFIALGGSLFAQTATDENEGATLTLNPTTGAHTFSWWGKTGRTYFVQHSSDLLVGWTYVPELIEVGNNAVTSWNFTSTDASGVDSEKFFIRLKGSDIPTSTPLTADFDEDGVGNMDELNQATDPLRYVDSEPDGMSDAWEIKKFGNLLRDGTGDLDVDGINDRLEFVFGLNPGSNADATQDGDGDGVTNAGEATQGSAANQKDNPLLQLSVNGYVAP